MQADLAAASWFFSCWFPTCLVPRFRDGISGSAQQCLHLQVACFELPKRIPLFRAEAATFWQSTNHISRPLRIHCIFGSLYPFWFAQPQPYLRCSDDSSLLRFWIHMLACLQVVHGTQKPLLYLSKFVLGLYPWCIPIIYSGLRLVYGSLAACI